MQQVFQVNAFTTDLFSGNPALVCPLQQWPSDALMRRIAAESRLTCAFFVGGEGHYRLRWFTPTNEIEGICGHGTLAAGFVVLNELGEQSDEVTFQVPAGELRVRRAGDSYILDLPALNPLPQPMPDNLADILGCAPQAVLGALDLIAVLPTGEDVAEFKPDFKSMLDLPLRALIVTAPGSEADFVSRWFGQKFGAGEDTGITGSAHCSLVPYWAHRLGKTNLQARQLSPRGGALACALTGNRVWLTCSAVKYMQSYLHV